MPNDNNHAATATDTDGSAETVTVICRHTRFDQQLDQYAFVFHIYGSRQRFTLHHTNPISYRLGHTYRLTLTPLPRRPGDPPAERTDRAADAA